MRAIVKVGRKNTGTSEIYNINIPNRVARVAGITKGKRVMLEAETGIIVLTVEEDIEKGEKGGKQ